MRKAWIACGCVAWMLTDARVWAQNGEPVEQAKTYFRAGAEAYDAGQFDAAAQAFELAYKLAPRDGTLFSLAQAQRRQYYLDKNPENLRKAIGNYREYVSKVQQGGRRADAAQALAELEPMAARLGEGGTGLATPEKPPTRLMITSQTLRATVVMDHGKSAPAPFISEVRPGKHHIQVTAPGYFDEQRDLVAAEGGVVAFDVTLREQPAMLTIVGMAGGEVSVDGRMAGVTPLAAPLQIPSGRHVVAIHQNGRRSQVYEVSLARAARRTLPYQPQQTSQRWAAYGVLTGAATSLVAGVVFTGLAVGAQSRAQDVISTQASRNIDRTDADRYDEAIEDRDRWRTAATVSFSVALGLGITGGLLCAFDRPSAGAPSLPTEQTPTQTTPKRSGPSLELSAAPYWTGASAGMRVMGVF